MWAAVVEDAVRLYVRGNADAAGWLFGSGGEFVEICDLLGVEPRDMRSEILRRKRREGGRLVEQFDLLVGLVEPLRNEA